MRIANFFLGFFATLMIVGASDGTAQAASGRGVDVAFGPLIGTWRGKGVIIPSPDKPSEKIFCRVIYSPKSKTAVTMQIRCAGSDFKVKASGAVTFNARSNRFAGRLSDSGFGWGLDLTAGRKVAKGLRFDLEIKKAEVVGTLNVTLRSSKAHSWLAFRRTPSGLKKMIQIEFKR